MTDQVRYTVKVDGVVEHTHLTYDEMQSECLRLYNEGPKGSVIKVFHITLDGKEHLVEEVIIADWSNEEGPW